jgi:hypothetical protein
LRAAGEWDAPHEPEAPPSRRVPFWALGVAILLVGALIGGVLAVLTHDDDAGSESATEPTDGTDPGTEPPATAPPTTEAPDLEAVVADIEAFVSAERGLPFLREVTVELAPEGEFQERLLEDFEEDVPELEVTGQVLEALGLVPVGTDVVESFRGLLGAGVVGFYDAATNELVVRGGEATPYVRTVIAHELVHALDDQHFELERPELDDAPDEAAFGFTSLVEGNASRIEQAYRATLTEAEQQEAIAEEAEVGAGYELDLGTLALLESVLAPYVLGPDLIDALLDDGGQARLDAAFTEPPTTSEALLFPETFIDGQASAPVPSPTADGPEIDRHVLGAIGLAQVLGEMTFVLGGVGELSDDVEGWGGDQYVAWTDGDRACVRVNIVGDTPEDTEEIGDALAGWAAAPPPSVEAEVEQGDVVTLTSCA